MRNDNWKLKIELKRVTLFYLSVLSGISDLCSVAVFALVLDCGFYQDFQMRYHAWGSFLVHLQKLITKFVSYSIDLRGQPDGRVVV